MNLPKYDVFVCSLKNPNVLINQQTEEIMIKIYKWLRDRLTHAHDMPNVVVDVHRYVDDDLLTKEQKALLLSNKFYLSEHYLSQRLNMETVSVPNRVFQTPWRTRPSLDAYTYVENGKRPLFQAMVIGGVNSGKTFVMHELKVMLRALVPGIEIIECDNDLRHPDDWDITSDRAYYKEYAERVRNIGVCIGNGPTTRVSVDNQIQHNTKI